MASPYRPFSGGPAAAAIRATGTTSGRQRFGRISMRIPTSDDTFRRYGLSARVATPQQLADRIADGYTGQGRYKRNGRMRMRGKGGFWGDLWNGTAGIRSTIGRSLRGGSAGAWGSAAGHAMQALGVGEYVTNDLVNGGGGQPGSGIPSFSPGQEGSVIVSHEEYLCDVFGPAANTFENKSYPVNPGLETSFPWLAQIAQNYDEYTIHQLMYTYRSSVAPLGASGSGQVGSVIMATQYNPEEDPFTNKGAMLQYASSRSARVIDGMIHGVECNPNMNSGAPGKFVRTGPVRNGIDLKSYDVGTFNMAIDGVPPQYQGQSIGELYVSYTVELRKPRLYEAQGFGIQRSLFVIPWQATPLPIIDPMGSSLRSPNQKLLQGQQNDLGIMIDGFDGPDWAQLPAISPTSQATCFSVKFPDALYGTFKVTVTAQGNQLGNPTVPPAPPQPIRWIGETYWSSTGNVTPVRDMIATNKLTGTVPFEVAATVASPQMAWDYINTAYGSNAIGGYTLTSEFHVRVDIQDGNLGPNQCRILYAWQLTNGAPQFNQVTIDVTEYNSGFNYKQDGSNDQVMLKDSTGNLVNPTAVINGPYALG